MSRKFKFTKARIDRIPLSPAGETINYWDASVTGFGLRVSSQNKTYFVRGRLNKVAKNATIGRESIFTPEQAREEARQFLQAWRQGVDLKKERAARAREGRAPVKPRADNSTPDYVPGWMTGGVVDEDARDIQWTVRWTVEEAATIFYAARKANEAPMEYVREAVLQRSRMKVQK